MTSSDSALASGDTTESPARAAIRRGAEWFVENQNDNFIYYGYDPERAAWHEESHGVREIASLWSLTEAARFLDEPRLWALCERGFAYFERFLRRDPEGDFLVLAMEPPHIKICYNAFAILALLNLEHRHKDLYLHALAEGLLRVQDRSGRLAPHFYSQRMVGQDYYPGQSLLALMSLHEATGERRYLEAVARALPYYRSYWARNPNTAFAPWQIQAFVKLARSLPDPAVRAFVFDMGDYLYNAMVTDDGKAFDFERGIVVAVYLEGINRAYALAGETGQPNRQGYYARLIREGSQAVMALQCPSEGEDREALPLPALGGFYGSQRDRSQRCDRNQHAILALMGAVELGLIA